LTEALTRLADDGTRRIETDALTKEAIRLGEDSRVDWRVESVSMECHPLQEPRPHDRTTFDAYYEGPAAIIH